ncbi:MAG: hypothetical protein O2979_08775 [Proteobacteria bacterium]|nr:hypothetical protein [Pseudomonadota bacterium]
MHGYLQVDLGILERVLNERLQRTSRSSPDASKRTWRAPDAGFVTPRSDEARPRDTAIALGAAEMPAPAKRAMRAMAKVMTTIASRV